MESLPTLGDGPRDEEPTPPEDPTRRLALRPAPFALEVGELVAEERLEMRGIFVGVSFDRADDALRAERGGASLAPGACCAYKLPTEGEPAIVGN